MTTVPGPFADLAESVAPDGQGGVAVTAAQGTAPPPAADDLTVLRLDASGAVVSSRRFTSPCGVSGSVLGVASGATVYVAASTACSAVVPGLGAGPLPPGGALLALPPDGTDARSVGVAEGVLGGAIDAQGRLAVLTGGGGSVAVVTAAGTAWQVPVDGGSALAPSPDGGVVVGAVPAGAASRLVALDGAGAERWRRALPAGFGLRHLAVLSDGAIAVTGVLDGAASFGAGSVGADGEQRQVVLAVEPDGTPRTAAEISDAAADQPAVRVAALPHGRALLYGFPGCDRLRGLTPQLQPVWARALDAQCAAVALGATLTAQAGIAVVGAFRGQADFGNGFTAAAQGTLQDGFVLGLAP